MTYETMDWEAEAKRVAAAFGLEGEYRFEPFYSYYSSFIAVVGKHEDRKAIGLGGFTELLVEYRPEWMNFCILDSRISHEIELENTPHVNIEIRWDGFPISPCENGNFTSILAKGLFHLGLLTPQVEAALEVAISNHQKLEWALDYEQRQQTGISSQ